MTDDIKTACECNPESFPFDCARHGNCQKTPNLLRLCRQRPDYFALWEAGGGPCISGESSGVREQPAAEPVDIQIDPADIPSAGFGDTLEKVFAKTGIAWFVKRAAKVIGKDCGCAERKKWLNQLLPYRPAGLTDAQWKATMKAAVKANGIPEYENSEAPLNLETAGGVAAEEGKSATEPGAKP